MIVNLIAIRKPTEDYDPCSGCGRRIKTFYQIMGRRDFKEKQNANAVYFCYICFRNLKPKVELIKE